MFCTILFYDLARAKDPRQCLQQLHRRRTASSTRAASALDDGNLALQELHNQIRAVGADRQQQHLVDLEHTEDPAPRPGEGWQQLHRRAGLAGNAAGEQPRARAQRQHLVMAIVPCRSSTTRSAPPAPINSTWSTSIAPRIQHRTGGRGRACSSSTTVPARPVPPPADSLELARSVSTW